MTYCKLDLKRQFVCEDDSLFLSYPSTEQEAWATFSEFNFDATGVTINFSPYDVLPYACGFQEVKVPWERLREHVAEPLATLLKPLLGART